MKNELNAAAQAVGESGSKFAGDIADAATQAGQLVKKAGVQQLEAARGAVADAQDAMASRARHYAGNADSYVREYPWKAIGLAAVAGAVLALLFARS